MPEQIEAAFQAAGVTLFPAAEDDLTTDCTCPDWANPCKHVAAVFYLLGERFDADPFLMFELRGRTQAQLVEALRARRADSAPPQGAEPAGPERPSPGEGGGAEDAAAAPDSGDVSPLLPAGASTGPASAGLPPAEAFWSAPADPAALPIAFQAPAVDALPIKRLGAPPFWQDWPDFATAAEQAYRAVGERALRLATEETP
jgi:uncharacterized Zn finger protein